MTEEERFWAKVKVGGDDECWQWTAGKSKQGYGIFHPNKTASVLAHRYVFSREVGELRPGVVVDHRCHNGTTCPAGPCEHRLCCNPRHLEAVTNTENVNRSHNSNARKTHCPHGHEYTPENTIIQVLKNTELRKCRECAREYDRKRSPRRKKSRNGE